MKEYKKLKLFISYSHVDEEKIKKFRKHITPLKDNGLISDWYDRKIVAGQNFRKEIDNNLEDADIICLFISANFLFSDECKQEKIDALELKRKKAVTVIPIILADCGWKDDTDIYSLLVLPTDATPVSRFDDVDAAWNDVYEGLKSVIQKENIIRQLEISDQCASFLQSTELLTKAHLQKDEVLLNEIFVYPELTRYDSLRGNEKKESSEKLLENFYDNPKMLIAGEGQSGKTTLCKIFYNELHQKNFIPIYISDKKNKYSGKIENKIKEAFQRQYRGGTSLEEIDSDRVVLLIDDFHVAKKKEKLIQDIALYHYQIIIVDEIFSLNFRDEKLTKSFEHYKIEEFIPSQRNELIKKWVQLDDSAHSRFQTENSIYQEIDRTTELVNSALGKSIGSGLMPAYPFFILTVLTVHDTKPIDREITSQGYCYQALIYIYLTKQGVKSDDIDTYLNFLTEIAFYFFDNKKSELTADDYEDFISFYKDEYNLPISEATLISNLHKTNIFSADDFNNYSFSYTYLYYFFIAKYLAENLHKNKKKIISIINNLDINDNAYIAIFLSHHSKDNFILERIISIASTLFEQNSPLTLTSTELSFFDDQIDMIVQAIFPNTVHMPEQERENDLIVQDKLEELNQTREMDDTEDDDDEMRDLRRSIKTVEAMGMVIKNRAGSLKRDRLKSVFKEGMNVHLRFLKSFIELIKKEENQQDIVELISKKINDFIKNSTKKPDQDELERMSKVVFWNINYFLVYSVIDKIIHSLGSDKLMQIITAVCDKENTPAAFLVKHGILMWYKKNLQLDNIANRIKSNDFSQIAESIIKHRIIDHCRIHPVGYRKIQQIESRLMIPKKTLQVP